MPGPPDGRSGAASAAPLLRKAALGLVLLVLLWLSVATTMDGVLADRLPTTVLRWAPWSINARIAQGTLLIGDGRSTTPAAAAEARTLAQQALDRSPIQARAARVLGMSDLFRRDQAGAGAAFTYAEQMSRRDLATELYWIEAYVARGDIRGALHHYDVAMRTSVKSRAMLGNVIINAAAEPAIATELARLLKTKPSWLPEFYQRLMGQGENPASLLRIASVMAFDGRDPEQAPFVSMALNRLVALNAYDDARLLYARAHGGPDATIRNGGFEQPNRLQPFDWTIAGEPTYSGVVETHAGWPHGNALTVTGTEANDVARQLLLLAPGHYLLDADTANVRQERETRPILTITCLSGAGTPSAFLFSPAGAVPAPMTGSFTIPSGCPAQWLTIRNTPSFDPVESDPWIDEITVRRIAQ